MKVKNVSARLHWVGDVMCIPGQEAEIGDEWAASIDKAELVPVESPAIEPVVSAEPSKPAAEKAVKRTTRRAK